jgi:hypothetical protein
LAESATAHSIARNDARHLVNRPMILDLSDEETTALLRLLSTTIDNDRYPLSPRIQTLKAIRDKIRPEPPREALPRLRPYDPPTVGARRQRSR